MEEIQAFVSTPEKNQFLFQLKDSNEDSFTITIDNSFDFSIQNLKVSSEDEFLTDWCEKCNKKSPKTMEELLLICTTEYGVLMGVEDENSPLYQGQDVFDLENDNNDMKFVDRMRISQEDFNTDLLLYVFAYLTPENSLRLTRVSKLWKKLIETDSLWKEYCNLEGSNELLSSNFTWYQQYISTPWNHYGYLSLEAEGSGLCLSKTFDKTEFTFEFWMMEGIYASTWGVPFLNSDNYWSNGFGLWSTGNETYRFYVGNWNDSSNQSDIKTRALNVWNHYSFSVSSSKKIIYLNGEELFTSDTVTTTKSGGAFTIGYGDYAGHNYGILGGLAEIRMYDYAKSAQEVKKDYKRIILAPKNKKGLLFNFRFNKDYKVGDKVDDLSGNGYDAVLVGSVDVKSHQKEKTIKK